MISLIEGCVAYIKEVITLEALRRKQDLGNRYGRFVSQMITDMFRLS
jgi:hypothetical protein